MSRRRKNRFVLSTTQILAIFGISIVSLLFSSFSLGNISDINLPVVVLIITFVATALTLAIYFVAKRAQALRFKNTTLFEVDSMTGVEFEDFVASLYRKKGYHVQTTAVSGDLGVDLIAMRGNERIAVQVKRYKSSVGREAISDAVAGMAQYKCNQSAVVTNSYFTRLAKQLAYINKCTLIDRDNLGRIIEETRQA